MTRVKMSPDYFFLSSNFETIKWLKISRNAVFGRRLVVNFSTKDLNDKYWSLRCAFQGDQLPSKLFLPKFSLTMFLRKTEHVTPSCPHQRFCCCCNFWILGGDLKANRKWTLCLVITIQVFLNKILFLIVVLTGIPTELGFQSKTLPVWSKNRHQNF